MTGVRRENGSTNNNSSSSPVNADHIPPKDTLKKASDILTKTGKMDDFRREHPALYDMINKSDKQLCREVFEHHHRLALTSCSSTESRVTR